MKDSSLVRGSSPLPCELISGRVTCRVVLKKKLKNNPVWGSRGADMA